MIKMKEFNGLTFREKGMFHVLREKDIGGNVSIIPFLHMKARLLCSEDDIRTFASVLVYFPLTYFAQPVSSELVSQLKILTIALIWISKNSYYCCWIQRKLWEKMSFCWPLFSYIRVLSHESRNELKPVWDFISVENLTSLFSQLVPCVHMSWGKTKLKQVSISYRSFCSI